MSEQVIHIGTVIEVKADKSLVKVDVLGRITDWLPLLQQANSFKRQFVSVRKGQQVVVLANRVVIGSIFNVDCLEPNGANEHIDIVEYEDGTRFEYDTELKKLTINAVNEIDVLAQTTINITCEKDVNIKAKDAVVEADTVKVNSTDIKLNNGKGVVTGAHICMVTGTPHSSCSMTVTAGE